MQLCDLLTNRWNNALMRRSLQTWSGPALWNDIIGDWRVAGTQINEANYNNNNNNNNIDCNTSLLFITNDMTSDWSIRGDLLASPIIGSSNSDHVTIDAKSECVNGNNTNSIEINGMQ